MTPEAWAALASRVESVETALRTIHDDQTRMMADRSMLLERLTNAIGDLSQDGKGGSGLVGEIARLQRDVSEIIALKNQGIGLIIAVSIFGVLIVLGIRQWITGIIGVHP